MIGNGHFERDDSEFRNSVRWPESPRYDALIDHNGHSHSNSSENEVKGFTGNGRNTTEVDSGCEPNRLSGELIQRITQEMNGLMNSVSLQIQPAINEAMNEHFLPQLQASLGAVNGLPSNNG